MNCNLAQYVVRCEGLGLSGGDGDGEAEVAVVRLPLITYEWWRRMQLQHFTTFEPVLLGGSGGSGGGDLDGGGALFGIGHAVEEAETEAAKAPAAKLREARTGAAPLAAGDTRDASPMSAAVEAKKKKVHKKKSKLKRGGGKALVELAPNGWRVYGQPAASSDAEHAAWEGIYAAAEAAAEAGTAAVATGRGSIAAAGDGSGGGGGGGGSGRSALQKEKALRWRARGPASPATDPARSVAFPGSRHHPNHRSAGSFTMDEFLALNCARRPVFLAGDFKAGDESWQRSGERAARVPEGSERGA